MSSVIEDRMKLLKIVFVTFTTMLFLVLLFIIFAMIFYPGGNAIDHFEDGYTFLRNTMCDLREVVAINGEYNLISSIFIKTSTILASIAIVGFFSTIWIFFQDTKPIKQLSWVATGISLLFGPFYICIFFVQANHHLHMFFDTIAPLSLNIAVIMYTIFYLIKKQLPKINQYSFLVLSICAVAYSVIVGVAEAVGGDFKLYAHRLGSNMFFLFMFFIFLIQGIGYCIHLWKRK